MKTDILNIGGSKINQRSPFYIPSIILVIVALPGIVITILTVYYGTTYGVCIPDGALCKYLVLDDLAKLGDFFGGVLNPVVSLSALIALMYAIKVQSEEMTRSSQIMMESVVATRVQIFNEIFIQLVSEYKDCVKIFNSEEASRVEFDGLLLSLKKRRHNRFLKLSKYSKPIDTGVTLVFSPIKFKEINFNLSAIESARLDENAYYRSIVSMFVIDLSLSSIGNFDGNDILEKMKGVYIYSRIFFDCEKVVNIFKRIHEMNEYLCSQNSSDTIYRSTVISYANLAITAMSSHQTFALAIYLLRPDKIGCAKYIKPYNVISSHQFNQYQFLSKLLEKNGY